MKRFVRFRRWRSQAVARVAAVGATGLLTVLLATPASADQFTIRNGVGAGDNSSAGISIAGDGFSLSFEGSSSGSVSDLGTVFCNASPCSPVSISFNHRFEGYLGSGWGSIGGTTYDHFDLDGIIDISGGEVTVRSRIDGWVVAEGLFRFAAWLDGSHAGVPLFSHRFTGRGTAAAYFAPSGLDVTVLTFDDALVTPEPSTFMLVGLGAAALARRRLRRGTA